MSPGMSTSLTAFYKCEERNTSGVLLSDIWKFRNDQLESGHDYIQWLFPTEKASNFNLSAPRFPPDVQEEFRTDREIRKNIRHSFDVFCGFLGIEYNASSRRCTKTSNFDARAQNWLSASYGSNHNWLRLTRILDCLHLVDEHERKRALYDFLDQLRKDDEFPARFSKSTFDFWKEAARVQEQTTQAPCAQMTRTPSARGSSKPPAQTSSKASTRSPSKPSAQTSRATSSGKRRAPSVSGRGPRC